MEDLRQKRPVYNGYIEHYMTGVEIREHFKNSYECFGKHHMNVSADVIDLKRKYPKIKDDVIYRVFINDLFCSIFDNLTDEKLCFFGYIEENKFQ